MHIQVKYAFLIMSVFTDLCYKINPEREKLKECCVRILTRDFSAGLCESSAGSGGVAGARYGRGRGGKGGERLGMNVFHCGESGESAGTLRCLRPRRHPWKAGA